VAITTGSGNNISIHIAPNRFSQAIKLYTTVGHELNHAVDIFSGSFGAIRALGGLNLARSVTEYKAHTWSYNVGKKISFESARHQAAIAIYRSRMTPADWNNLFKISGF